ncbi:hypothetical protein [Heyndrickxia camelliae]|nr:hypothetical protein [Heyndrickxia camelliae]
MILNVIFSNWSIRKKAKAIKEYKQLQHIANILEQNKLKHNEGMLRHYY